MDHSDRGIDRRRVLTLGGGLLGLATLGPAIWPTKSAAAATLAPSSLSPEEALQRLIDGNQRFTGHHLEHPDQSEERVLELTQSQHPFATVLSCADSRVAAEIIFDQGLGDIFDVRVAGNIATPEVVGSIEYAVELLETPLLMVLGHERCGAVTAAVKNEPLPGDIGTFVQAILPAVNQVKGQPGDAVDNAVTANVRYQVEQVLMSSLVRDRQRSGQLQVVGARYDLDTGTVTLVT
ncbi:MULTISPECIES: carbonic anhydrase [Cyanophyceae]|uniref:carbonic anhydrase n=1 Tax=Cyanophyceae TaxID=3028117 RepID=UPI001682813A|nr:MULTISPECIES: carbonic anhydrase [Cyanophyceae]MBD1915203.1 carbonic anhydrase [Phormidium sp. FACHB-77]MBD2032520.1 carbonic anhydrase [Phormidium sp. FACHB-322]MBD2050949.1 carbonic anhydrase [Leptolyngbya sp. FACHB-60]